VADDDVALLSLELPPRLEASSAARKALTSLNGAMHLVSEARLRDVQLMAAELVANAVLHGGDRESPVRIEVRATEDTLRVVVMDVGRGFDARRLAGPSIERGGGWGLRLVASIAHRWGVESGPPTRVWFEIDRPRRKAEIAADDTTRSPPRPTKGD
jgi:anti-sigma regulatory factor (Ser/Thr protein kinase)